MQPDILSGKFVRLTAIDVDEISKSTATWSNNSEFLRLMDAGATQPYSPRQIREWYKQQAQIENTGDFHFSICTLAENRLIGDIGLDGVRWNHADSFVGIGIGEQQYWGKGYGTDAMRIILRYAFTELNLQRVSLNVFEYNLRAVRSYEKVGFTQEGRVRQYLNKAGRRWDLIYMGITREEWQRS